MNKNHIGESFDSFLKKEGTFKEIDAAAKQRIATFKSQWPQRLPLFVVVDENGLAWQETARTNRRESIEVIVAWRGMSWKELKKLGCYTTPATLTVEKKAE